MVVLFWPTTDHQALKVKTMDDSLFFQNLPFVHMLYSVVIAATSSYHLSRIWDKIMHLE